MAFVQRILQRKLLLKLDAARVNAFNIRSYSCVSRLNGVNNGLPVLTCSSHVKKIQIKEFSLSPLRLSEGGSHVGIWMGERVLGIGIAVTLPLAILTPHPIFDYAAATMMIIHAHWGIEAIAVDYVRKVIFGPIIPKIAYYGVYVFSISALGGLLYFNYTDIGLGNAIRMLWKL